MPTRFSSNNINSNHVHEFATYTDQSISMTSFYKFGAKYLEKYGYKEGGGVGANEQGILAPIQATMRPKNMGLGFDNRRKKKANDQPLQQRFELTIPHVKKGDCFKKTKKNICHAKSIESKKNHDVPVVKSIIDMRGPDVRIITDLKSFQSGQEEQVDNDIFESGQEEQINMFESGQEGHSNMVDSDNQYEEEKRKKKKKKIDDMEDVMRVLDRIEDLKSVGMLTLEFLAEKNMDLLMRYTSDYVSLDLSSIAYSYALPLLIKLFQGWDPLQARTHGVEVVCVWNKLLLGKDYEELVMEVVYPAVRVAATNSWQVREPEPMLMFLESWYRVLPRSVMRAILDHVVLPKLVANVESWDPVKETVPIDCWIHPWLPLLGEKLGGCFDTIRDGFSGALQVWELSDGSVYRALCPWKDVFDSTSWDRLMVRYIIPKLLSIVKDLQLNLANKELYLDHFYLVQTWASVITVDGMLKIMDVFFNKWQEVLYQWLCSDPDFGEVGRWFLEWKELLPVELKSNEYIQYRLSIGLSMMNQAVEGLTVSRPCSISKEDFSHFRKRVQKPCDTQSVLQGHSETEMSLKEIIEIYAQQNGILFKPKDRMSSDGLQIYGFGKISIVIDSLNQKVSTKFAGEWSLVSLNQLLELQN